MINPFIKEDPFSLILVVILSFLFLYKFGPAGRRLALLDKPVGRKQHAENIPLVGGLGISAAVFLSISLLPFGLSEFRILFFAAGLLLIVGVLDDHRDVSPGFKLFAQSLVAIVIVSVDGTVVHNIGDIFSWDDGNRLGLGVLAYPLSALAVVGVINAMNMIDGHDGLASGVFLLSIASILALAGFAEAWKWHYLLLLFMASVLVHLFFNLGLIGGLGHKVFLGDAGSMVLGLVIVYSLISLSEGDSPVLRTTLAPWFLGLPLLDMVAVVMVRVWRRASPFHADRTHLHHLLLSVGISRIKALVALLFLHLMLCVVGLLGHSLKIPDWILFWGMFPVLIVYILSRQVLIKRSLTA